jgi:hypothetical protein
MRLVGLRQVALNDVELREIFLDPVSVSLGEQLFTNEEFFNMTIGAEVLNDPGFDTPAEWTASGNWVVSGSAATHTAPGNDNLTSVAAVTTTGKCYQVIAVTTVATEDGQMRYTSNRWANVDSLVDSGAATYTTYIAAAGNNDPTRPNARSAGATTGTWTMTSLSVKETTLDTWSIVGTQNASEYLVFNATDKTVRIVSGGNLMGISQVIPDFVAGDYFYRVNIPVANSGSMILNTVGDGTVATFTSIGLHEGVVSLTDSDLRLGFGASGDATVSSFKLYPVIGE